MDDIEKIKAHYGFTANDAKNLKSLRPVMDRYVGAFEEEFYAYLKNNFEDTPKFLKNPEVIKRHQDAIGKWFVNLFSGDYDSKYFHELERVGMVHVNIGLDAHYVNAAMHFVQRYIMGVLSKEIKDPGEFGYIGGSVHKILDINLDVFTSSYIEEEKRAAFISYKLESQLVQFAKRFTYGLNLILVLGLVVLGVLVMWLFAYDIMHVFDGNIEKGLLSTLGTLLMLWVVIELMDTEISHLKGSKFAIKVFISVALVAIIRKILVTSLSTEAVGTQISLVAAVAVLGVVYWLIARTEQ